MAIIEKVEIENYRSIKDAIEITFHADKPLILVGENNSGKSNITKAIDLVLGERWPGSYEPEDHEFFGRERTTPIDINIYFENDPASRLGRYHRVRWYYNPLEEQDPLTFSGYPGSRGRSTGYISNDDRENCISVVIGPDRQLNYQLSYRSKWTFLSKLMRKFHNSLLSQEDTKDDLERIFEIIKEKFHEVEPFERFSTSLQNDFESLLGSMTHRLEVDFQAYNPVNFFHALRLQAIENDDVRTIEELGTGEEQLLAIAFAHAYARAFHGGILLIIEEPESNLHPLMQKWLSRKIHKMAQDGLQILITTHSPIFINLLQLEGLVLVRKDSDDPNSGTKTIQIDSASLVENCIRSGVPESKINVNNVLPFYSANSTTEILEGFFAKRIILVEGNTEALTLPIYMEKSGYDTLEHGIAVIPVFGKGNLSKWKRLFSTYGIPTYIIFDNDEENDENGNRRTDILLTLGADHQEIDQLITQSEWIINQKFSIFGVDYESTLRSLVENYVTLEEEARSNISTNSKPFIARYVANNLELPEDHPLHTQISLLSEHVLSL
mgnify:CR=1 FL=1